MQECLPRILILLVLPLRLHSNGTICMFNLTGAAKFHSLRNFNSPVARVLVIESVRIQLHYSQLANLI